MLAVAAASALVAALAAGTGSDKALAVLLAPLCCASARVLTFRAAGFVLRVAERVARAARCCRASRLSTSPAPPE